MTAIWTIMASVFESMLLYIWADTSTFKSTICNFYLQDKDMFGILTSISDLSAYLSISFWLFAQLPQVIKNHADKSVEGLSLAFLICWFAGDLLNFVSCILNDALMFQVLLSGYYCTIDLVLGFQFYYYKCMYNNAESSWYHHKPSRKLKEIKSPRSSLRSNLERYGSGEIPPESINIPKGNAKSKFIGILKSPGNSLTSKLISTSFIAGFSKVQALPISKEFTMAQRKIDNSILHKIIIYILTLDVKSTGKILAWACTTFYLISRIPQIITNYKVKSTSGVSLKLVCFALCGNFFYSLSLFLCEDALVGGEISNQFWKAELSYLIGSLGTVSFDFIVLLQWYHYDKKIRHYQHNCSHLDENNNSQIFKNNRQKFMVKVNSPLPISSPINFMSPLSSNHVRKLSEFTPLSPMDFLLDGYMEERINTLRSTPHSSIRGSFVNPGGLSTLHPLSNSVTGHVPPSNYGAIWNSDDEH